jgi:flagellar P-ring protein precursor FlgI
MRQVIRALIVFAVGTAFAWALDALPSGRVRVRDIASVEGVRENSLIGYGIVVGLNGTGDRRQTVFTTQTLANVLQKMGVQISPGAVRVNNIASVFVTASLPPFAHSGTRLDVTVSSIGDAKSVEGGLLLMTPLYGGDGQVYATAQGPLTLGGYVAGGAANSKQVNHPTVARIPSGGVVEREFSLDLAHLPRLSLILNDADFAAARDVAAAVNQEFRCQVAVVVDGRRIDLDPDLLGRASLPKALARVEALTVEIRPRARVVVNERTGTIVMGRDVRLSPVSILHGNLSIEISTVFEVSQPSAMAQGDTVVVPKQSVRTQDSPVRRVELSEGATVEQLINGLQAIGATARDVVAILQAIKAAGALQAELEVI